MALKRRLTAQNYSQTTTTLAFTTRKIYIVIAVASQARKPHTHAHTRTHTHTHTHTHYGTHTTHTHTHTHTHYGTHTTHTHTHTHTHYGTHTTHTYFPHTRTHAHARTHAQHTRATTQRTFFCFGVEHGRVHFRHGPDPRRQRAVEGGRAAQVAVPHHERVRELLGLADGRQQALLALLRGHLA